MSFRKKLGYFFISLIFGLSLLFFILLSHSNKILKYELQRFLGKGFSVERLELEWGSVLGEKIGLHHPEGKKFLEIERLSLKSDFISLLKKENIISVLILEDPYLLLEVNKKGELLIPLTTSKSREKKRAGETMRGFLFREIEVKGGALDYLDRKVEGSPALIRLRDIHLNIENLSIPPENTFSDFKISASLPGRDGKGSLQSAGKINLKSGDAKAKLIIKDIDLTDLKPYYRKKGDVEVTRGRLSVISDIKVSNSKILSEGKLVITDLEFVSAGGRFLGFPLVAVTKLIKDSSNQIEFDFVLEGDLNNPKFRIRDSLLQKITFSLARTLGLPLESIGKSVFELGEKALNKIFN